MLIHVGDEYEDQIVTSQLQEENGNLIYRYVIRKDSKPPFMPWWYVDINVDEDNIITSIVEHKAEKITNRRVIGIER